MKIKESSDLSKAIINSGFTEQIFDDYIEIVGDTKKDWIKHLFQYYEADRKGKKQDYTPVCLADCVAKLSHKSSEKICFDMCAGSGALTIQKYQSNPNLHFICAELDENVIPFLLFNLALHNISATVIHCDVLSGEKIKAWEVYKGNKFGKVTETEVPKQVRADICISNPPYNMKWSIPPFAQMQDRFASCELPPTSNANYAFILTALDNADRVSMIMPTCILSSDNMQEREIRRYLVDNNLIDSVVINPDKMFDITTIGTCLVTFAKKRKTTRIAMVDMRKHYSVETRKQNGQFGGASHEKRTYTKDYKVYTREQQAEMLETIEQLSDVPGFSKVVTKQEIQQKNYLLTPSKYIEFENQEIQHRPYGDIVKDLNRIIIERNCCKLVINETIAKSIGIYNEFELNNKTEDIADSETAKLIEKLCGEKLIKNDYIKLTKNKNELSFCNNSKEKISTIFTSIMKMWKQHVRYLNEQENIYLAEMRDALLPDLMNGKINVDFIRSEANE